MAKPKVSILIPIFNVERYLDECLTSVVAQTLKDIEIICINDGSTDNSLKIIRKYAKNDKRIKIIDKKNSGYGDSMNQGLAEASGEYVGIIESDDFADLDMFESLYKLAKDSSAEVVKSNFYIHYSDLSQSSPQWNSKYDAIYSKEFKTVISRHDTLNKLVIPDYANKLIDTRNKKEIFCKRPAIWSAIYERDFLEKNGIKFLASPGASYQDTGFSFKVWSQARKAYFTERAFLHYRQDNENSSVHNPGKVFCVNDEYAEISSYIIKHHLGTKVLKIMNTAKYGTYLWNFDRLDNEFKPKFLTRFSAEFKQAINENLLNFDDFNVIDQYNIKEIAHRPKKFLERHALYSKVKLSVIFALEHKSNTRLGLDTILRQTYQEVEIICVSYGSPTEPNKIALNYYKKDPRIKLYLLDTDDTAAALNFGMARTLSEYFVFGNPKQKYGNTFLTKLGKATANGSDIILHSNLPLGHRRKILTDELINRTNKSIFNKLFKTIIQRKFDVWFPGNVVLGNIKFVSDYMVVCKTISSASLQLVRKPALEISASSAISPPDYIAPLFASFQFLKRNNLVVKHQLVFLHNLKTYYNKALSSASVDEKPNIKKAISDFISTQTKYIGSVDNKLKAAMLSAIAENRTD